MKQFILTSVLITGCAAPSAQPLRYPALPPAPGASSEPDTFTPSAALSPLSNACRAAELPVPNALDDDCDGSIDSFAKDTPLLIALSFPRAIAADLALAIRSDKSIEVPLVATSCPDSASFCTVYVETKNLARGSHALLARHSDQGAHSGTHALAVSVQSRGKVTTYVATLAADVTEQSLGAVALP